MNSSIRDYLSKRLLTDLISEMRGNRKIPTETLDRSGVRVNLEINRTEYHNTINSNNDNNCNTEVRMVFSESKPMISSVVRSCFTS